MGNECMASTPNQKYKQYLQQIKVSELKDLWQTVKIYKLKKLFDSAASSNQDKPQELRLNFEGFRKLFPELEGYPEQQVYRLYEVFDFQNIGYVNWSNFYSTVTILYFGSEKTLALILFMMFDHTLELNLDNPYLKLMLETNELCLKLSEEGDIQEASQIYHYLMSEEGLSIRSWLRQADKFIDFSKFRKLFNIFTEEKMQKELVRCFYNWNQIYDSEKQKYIGYLMNLKWFQSWRLYISQHYNINIDIYSSNKSTIRTIKTCKNTYNKLRTIKLGIDTSISIHECRIIDLNQKKDKKVKNIDCVHNHLGEKPREITNNQLQGEFQEVLREGVSENRDYVIVSEKIWNHLKAIYDGYPEFRRTGFDTIELYPKIIKTYFSLFKGHIDYSTEVIREVSAYLAVDQLLINSCELTEESLKSKVIYYKTIGMQRWEKLEDASYLFTQISSQILIFLVCIENSEEQIFQKSHQKLAKDATQVNLGDYLHYKSSKGEEKTAIFMGKSTQGKYILHFLGQSYTSDVCLIQSDFLKLCKLSPKIEQIEYQKRVGHSNVIGLPSGPGLGFINSVFQIFMNSKQIRNQLLMMDHSRSDKLVYCLARLHNLLVKKARIEAMDIKDLIELYLGKYTDFEVGMAYNLLNDFFTHLSDELIEEEIPNIMGRYEIELEKNIECKHCKSKTTITQQVWALKVQIPEDKLLCYQIVWVPDDLQANKINKFKVKVKKQATLGELMTAFEQQMGSKDKLYILTEVYSFDIIKNYHKAQKSATLNNLRMRETDQLYAYELKTDFTDIVKNHFNNKSEIDEDQIKKDMFIDCKHPERGWIFGKVMEQQYMAYTQSSIVKVVHKFNKNESWQISYDVFQENIGRFPNKSYNNCEQYHLRLHQRIFNESSNSMKLINIPLITVLPAWMRWKQFYYFVYTQIRQFIASEYDIESDPDFDVEQSHLQGKKEINTKKNLGTRKQLVGKAQSFKDYKASSMFPYKLHLVDYEGRCAICFKFLKLIVFKGENDTYCEGCQLSQTQPISWQVKPADLLVCVDWIGVDRFKENIMSKHPTETTNLTESKKQQESLVHCLELMKEPYLDSEQSLCCNIFSEKSIVQKIIKAPEMLTIYLDRIAEEEDGFKKVIKKPIKFSTNELLIEGIRYKLTGVTSIEGEHLNIRHKSYILKEEEWYEYDGKLVRLVDSRYMQKVCAFVLYYHRANQ